MVEEFVSEAIEPLDSTFSTSSMAIGEPGLPKRFVWRDREYEVAEVLEQWKESGPCVSGANERYLRKHWYKIRTTDGTEMKLYFERQARSKGQAKARWWLYTVGE
jgi:phosphoribosylglycinamide formyltransferase-1